MLKKGFGFTDVFCNLLSSFFKHKGIGFNFSNLIT